jgi:hypothetical protein
VGDATATNAAGPLTRFAQRSGYSFSVLRRVDAGRSAASHDHLNLYSILQRTQLFEGFRALEGRRFPTDETEQEIASIAINALVAEIQNQGAAVYKPPV